MAAEFKKFPMMVYDHSVATPARDVKNEKAQLVHEPANHGSLIVNDDDELKAARAAGYREQPATFEAEELEEVETQAPAKPAKAKPIKKKTEPKKSAEPALQ